MLTFGPKITFGPMIQFLPIIQGPEIFEIPEIFESLSTITLPENSVLSSFTPKKYGFMFFSTSPLA